MLPILFHSEKLAEEVSKETSRILEIDTSTNERVVPEVKEDIRESERHNKLYMQAKIIINNLNKRQSHKLCKPLGIQQKCSKVEKSLTFIKAEIRSIFKDDPEKAIALVKERLPELISVFPEASQLIKRFPLTSLPTAKRSVYRS